MRCLRTPQPSIRNPSLNRLMPASALQTMWILPGGLRDAEALFTVEDLAGGETADRGVEELDHVKGGQGALPAMTEAAHKLEEAAGVGGDDGLRVGVKEMAYFAVAKLLGRFGLEEVVDTGGATTKRRFGDLGKFKLRDCGEKLPRLLMNSLCVTEVACVVVSDANGQGVAWGQRMARSKEPR